MAKIKVLDKHIAELIAAGEVVERPSAVIKELTENSIDAGATQITVEIRKGGVTYMRVSDNGSGIDKEDISKAFLRHATSKITQQEDLFEISTLGFRGEALASIAAMCKVEVQTRTQDSTEGVRYVIHGGVEQENQPVGCPCGTTIIVRDIFYNTPARMKFLKKDIAEGSAVASVVEKLAMAHPEISFKLLREGQVKLHTPGDGKLLSAIHAVHSREVTDALIPVDYTYNNIYVSGYITKPTHCRGNRMLQNFFINQRYVKTRTAAAALEEAYKHSVMVGKFPGCFLDIGIGFHHVDVNVHPAKTEVRFTDEKTVYEAVYYGVKSALSGFNSLAQQTPARKQVNPYVIDKNIQNPVQQRFSAQQYRQMVGGEKEEKLQKPKVKETVSKQVMLTEETSSVLDFQDDGGKGISAPLTIPKQQIPIDSSALQVKQAENSLYEEEEKPASKEIISQKENEPILQQKAVQEHALEPFAAPVSKKIDTEKPQLLEDAKPDRYAGAKLIGEVFSTYILLETENQLIFIDKHAAHERLRFNRLVKQVENGQRQLLLVPVVVNLPGEIYAAAVERLIAFQQVGILAEDFGDGALLVREMPSVLSQEDVAAVTEEIAVKLYKNQQDLTPEAVYELLHSIACRGSVMAGEQSGLMELTQLLDLLRQNEDVKFCPHGRPVEIALTKREVEKRFGRLG